GGEVDSFNDHRIVMAAAIAACICENPVIIHDAQAVNKSYPNFFEDYRKLGGKADVI
ncbi:MAG: 3-phosphoshikimate 1-carboxyvinyltransferase, partial [Oscillospiraceae bacterium]|nr:3-phosphoshikimate 1-carboxyvinyltransferase [Oscillospiraceae bacterium]